MTFLFIIISGSPADKTQHIQSPAQFHYTSVYQQLLGDEHSIPISLRQDTSQNGGIYLCIKGFALVPFVPAYALKVQRLEIYRPKPHTSLHSMNSHHRMW